MPPTNVLPILGAVTLGTAIFTVREASNSIRNLQRNAVKNRHIEALKANVALRQKAAQAETKNEVNIESIFGAGFDAKDFVKDGVDEDELREKFFTPQESLNSFINMRTVANAHSIVKVCGRFKTLLKEKHDYYLKSSTATFVSEPGFEKDYTDEQFALNALAVLLAKSDKDFLFALMDEEDILTDFLGVSRKISSNSISRSEKLAFYIGKFAPPAAEALAGTLIDLATGRLLRRSMRDNATDARLIQGTPLGRDSAFSDSTSNEKVDGEGDGDDKRDGEHKSSPSSEAPSLQEVERIKGQVLAKIDQIPNVFMNAVLRFPWLWRRISGLFGSTPTYIQLQFKADGYQGLVVVDNESHSLLLDSILLGDDVLNPRYRSLTNFHIHGAESGSEAVELLDLQDPHDHKMIKYKSFIVRPTRKIYPDGIEAADIKTEEFFKNGIEMMPGQMRGKGFVLASDPKTNVGNSIIITNVSGVGEGNLGTGAVHRIEFNTHSSNAYQRAHCAVVVQRKMDGGYGKGRNYTEKVLVNGHIWRTPRTFLVNGEVCHHCHEFKTEKSDPFKYGFPSMKKLFRLEQLEVYNDHIGTAKTVCSKNPDTILGALLLSAVAQAHQAQQLLGNFMVLTNGFQSDDENRENYAANYLDYYAQVFTGFTMEHIQAVSGFPFLHTDKALSGSTDRNSPEMDRSWILNYGLQRIANVRPYELENLKKQRNSYNDDNPNDSDDNPNDSWKSGAEREVAEFATQLADEAVSIACFGDEKAAWAAFSGKRESSSRKRQSGPGPSRSDTSGSDSTSESTTSSGDDDKEEGEESYKSENDEDEESTNHPLAILRNALTIQAKNVAVTRHQLLQSKLLATHHSKVIDTRYYPADLVPKARESPYVKVESFLVARDESAIVKTHLMTLNSVAEKELLTSAGSPPGWWSWSFVSVAVTILAYVYVFMANFIFAKVGHYDPFSFVAQDAQDPLGTKCTADDPMNVVPYADTISTLAAQNRVTYDVCPGNADFYAVKKSFFGTNQVSSETYIMATYFMIVSVFICHLVVYSIPGLQKIIEDIANYGTSPDDEYLKLPDISRTIYVVMREKNILGLSTRFPSVFSAPQGIVDTDELEETMFELVTDLRATIAKFQLELVQKRGKLPYHQLNAIMDAFTEKDDELPCYMSTGDSKGKKKANKKNTARKNPKKTSEKGRIYFSSKKKYERFLNSEVTKGNSSKKSEKGKTSANTSSTKQLVLRATDADAMTPANKLLQFRSDYLTLLAFNKNWLGAHIRIVKSGEAERYLSGRTGYVTGRVKSEEFSDEWKYVVQLDAEDRCDATVVYLIVRELYTGEALESSEDGVANNDSKTIQQVEIFPHQIVKQKRKHSKSKSGAKAKVRSKGFMSKKECHQREEGMERSEYDKKPAKKSKSSSSAKENASKKRSVSDVLKEEKYTEVSYDEKTKEMVFTRPVKARPSESSSAKSARRSSKFELEDSKSSTENLIYYAKKSLSWRGWSKLQSRKRSSTSRYHHNSFPVEDFRWLTIPKEAKIALNLRSDKDRDDESVANKALFVPAMLKGFELKASKNRILGVYIENFEESKPFKVIGPSKILYKISPNPHYAGHKCSKKYNGGSQVLFYKLLLDQFPVPEFDEDNLRRKILKRQGILGKKKNKMHFEEKIVPEFSLHFSEWKATVWGEEFTLTPDRALENDFGVVRSYSLVEQAGMDLEGDSMMLEA